MNTLVAALLAGLKGQADVEAYGEGTVVIIGPVDLQELADYLVTFGGIELQDA